MISSIIKTKLTVLLCAVCFLCAAQNPLFIPPSISGTNFNLNVQMGTTQFWPGVNTPTFGVNGNLLGPTLIVEKDSVVNIHVTNHLNSTTTMHWHGLHVPAVYDGGPDQVIPIDSTWNVHFPILNHAGTYWYHPHGLGKTDLQVSKGIAGFILVHDAEEASLNLPTTYGVDDIPLVIQSKAFDVLHQIAIASEFDTLMLVNGTVDPQVNLPEQLVRLRLLNGSSMRSYNIGFSNNMFFYMVATDGGLMAAPVMTSRVTIAPGERVEIIIDLSGMLGQSVSLTAYNSTLPTGVYGAATVGNGMSQIPNYSLNPLNGADFNLLKITVVAQTANPVLSVPSALASFTPYNHNIATKSRTFTLAPMQMGMQNMVVGPFGINGVQFSMDTINVIAYKNTTENWTIVNNTLIAHPFHIHDMQFYVYDYNGISTSPYVQGWKDVVLVMPQQQVSFVTRFEDYTNDTVPYMYHCHLLHHEDDGMMGSFVVRDSSTVGIDENNLNNNSIQIFPNPAHDNFSILINGNNSNRHVLIYNLFGEIVFDQWTQEQVISVSSANWSSGIYFLKSIDDTSKSLKFIVTH